MRVCESTGTQTHTPPPQAKPSSTRESGKSAAKATEKKKIQAESVKRGKRFAFGGRTSEALNKVC